MRKGSRTGRRTSRAGFWSSACCAWTPGQRGRSPSAGILLKTSATSSGSASTKGSAAIRKPRRRREAGAPGLSAPCSGAWKRGWTNTPDSSKTSTFPSAEAERDLRDHKNRLAVSGCFRTEEGLKRYVKLFSMGHKLGTSWLDIFLALINGTIEEALPYERVSGKTLGQTSVSVALNTP